MAARARAMVGRVLAATGGVAAWAEEKKEAQHLRSRDFSLVEHTHGKTRVRVMKARPGSPATMNEYKVQTTLWAPKTYAKVFTAGDNADLVATDTQKNQVYVVAKRTPAETPEDFGIALATHLLGEYPMLTKVGVEVEEIGWERFKDHDHAWLKRSPMTNVAAVECDRKKTKVVSQIRGLTFMKTTQSGFEGYLKDDYTLLPYCTERCLASELSAEWSYVSSYFSSPKIDYKKTRQTVHDQLLFGLFGPTKGGVYSPSLQNTIYDAACLVLAQAPAVADISISTPNLHYIPFKNFDAFGKGDTFEDDVFIPTSEPSGSIFCKVSRS